MGQSSSTKATTKLGDLLVKEGLLTVDGLQKALFVQKQSEVYRPLGKVCVDLKLISKPDLQRFLSKHHKRIQIGELLMHMGLITEKQLQHVLEQQRISSKRFGSLLVQSGIITESQLTDALSMQLDIPRILPSLELIAPSLLKGLDEEFLRKHEFLPVHRHANQMVVVMADPLNSELLQTLVDHFKCRIIPAIAPSSEIMASINELFNGQKKPAPHQTELSDELSSLNQYSHHTKEQVTPVANYLIRSAVEAGATALHIETQEKYVRVRFRIDGILRHKTDLATRLGPALIDCLRTPFRVKREKYWEEHISTRVSNRQVDLSISSFQGLWGDNLVVHILHTPTRLFGLENLGFSPLSLNKYTRLLDRAGGLVLVASPARSGKSTVLYASLLYLNQLNRSILTLEDNPEIKIPGVIQGRFNPEGKDSFESLIEAMKDYDSDILMVGRIANPGTVRHINQATLIGRKVLSALDACDTTAALYHLMENGGRQLLATPVPVTLVSQRLVRRLCDSCKTSYMPSEDEFRRLHYLPSDRGFYQFYRAVGCQVCDNQGYQGVTAVHEFLELNEILREEIARGRTASSIRQVARQTGQLVSLTEDGLYKAIQGLTTLEEVQRVTLAHDSESLPPSLQEIHSLCHGRSKDG